MRAFVAPARLHPDLIEFRRSLRIIFRGTLVFNLSVVFGEHRRLAGAKLQYRTAWKAVLPKPKA